jgi:hypothetical protein
MQAPNRKKLHPMVAMFALLTGAFMGRNPGSESGNTFAHHNLIMGGGEAEYHPGKHTIQTYRGQQRDARKRRRAK